MSERLFCLVLLVAAAGCGDIREPVIDVDNRRMVVVPFRDPLQYYFESPRGIRLARLVADQVDRAHQEDGDGVEAVAHEDLVAALRDDDPRTDLKFPYADVGRKTKADLVLTGNITRFEVPLKGDVGFLRGAGSVEIAVYETAKPEKALYKTTVSAIFPPEKWETGIGDAEVTEAEIESGLLAVLAKRIAEHFYPHEPEH